MSKRYDYMEAMVEDIKEYILNDCEELFDSRETAEQKLYDNLWTVDSITGNSSGSYTFNSWRAEEYVCHNLDLLKEALLEFGYPRIQILEDGPEACDVTIRCYLLGAALNRALDELENEGEIEFKGET